MMNAIESASSTSFGHCVDSKFLAAELPAVESITNAIQTRHMWERQPFSVCICPKKITVQTDIILSMRIYAGCGHFAHNRIK